MEPSNKISTEVSTNGLDIISFFDENDEFVVAYKKTEKLASAVYMITGLFEDREPMKWTLRKKVADALSLVLTFKDKREANLFDFTVLLKTQTLELISLLEISFRGGLISEMNFSILKQEFFNLVSIIDSVRTSRKSTGSNILSKSFFNTPHIAKAETKRNTIDTQNHEETQPTQPMSLKTIKDTHVVYAGDNSKKSSRQNIILNLLKRKGELTIKDMALVIKDCSEKTIQRELNSFIASGVLKRKGVRRWSKYSLNQG